MGRYGRRVQLPPFCRIHTALFFNIDDVTDPNSCFCAQRRRSRSRSGTLQGELPDCAHNGRKHSATGSSTKRCFAALQSMGQRGYRYTPSNGWRDFEDTKNPAMEVIRRSNFQSQRGFTGGIGIRLRVKSLSKNSGNL